MNYPRRLIEVDLPIRRISAHARREKSIRHGHISTLHIWWARRPLAACRAVICASLWPDPVDVTEEEAAEARRNGFDLQPNTCPPAFRKSARELMLKWTTLEYQKHLSPESQKRFNAVRRNPKIFDDSKELRQALLDFIADFANWDNSTVKEFLDTSRKLTQVAHEALGGAQGSRPLVVDPFAGGGSIPLEALRVGADVFASDLNPIPVLLNKVVLEFLPKFGARLAEDLEKGGEWIKREAEKELAKYYPRDPGGATPIAYLWSRTIKCEGPGCGSEVPLLRSLWLAKTPARSVALQIVPRPKAKRVDFQIIVMHRGGWVNQADPEEKLARPTLDGTVKRGSATCPCCGYTTPVARVREQLKARRGGANDARLLCVVTTHPNVPGRSYRLAKTSDMDAIAAARLELERRMKSPRGSFAPVPDEPISLNEMRRISIPIYGMETWGDVFSNRQNLLLVTLARLCVEAGKRSDVERREALTVLFALCLGRQADACSTLARWHTSGEKNTGAFGRQALGMVWDFCEVNPFSGSTGGWDGVVQWIAKVCAAQANYDSGHCGQVQRASAAAHPLSDDIASAWITDPPYYDSVPYSHLSDYFYVWLRRVLSKVQPQLFGFECAPKEEEIVVDRPHYLSTSKKDVAFYERELTKAFSEGRRVLRPDGIGAIVFASKTTASWEAILRAVVEAGWIITGSWPIDTEMEARVAAQGQARLASSVHLICRPRENTDGTIRTDAVGDWRDVLAELPRRIHDWMPRLADEGVVGADAIFACLGPALEIFSRYSRVEKASGEAVTLKEFLEQVWAAVSKEALTMIFAGADATGFEEDARLTAMWLWTLKTEVVNGSDPEAADEGSDEDEEGDSRKAVGGGFILEFDAARKIAQGLGAHLESLGNLVEVAGETARLLPVAERAPYLFGKDDEKSPARKKKGPQLDLFKALKGNEDDGGMKGESKVDFVGKTVLDRVHQSMLLFGAGRGEALKRLLVEEGVGRDERFWRLLQALTALYPASTDERRWAESVLARKKGLGL